MLSLRSNIIFMTPILIETQFFPCIDYLSLCIQSSSVVIEGCEHYQKGSYRNRCHIASANGLQVLSVPLEKGKNSQQSIRDVRISYDVDWQRQHWQSLTSAYGSSPYWTHYAPLFLPFFQEKYVYLFDYNEAILTTLFDVLKLNVHVTRSLTTDYNRSYTEGVDFRNRISPRRSADIIDTGSLPYGQVFADKYAYLPNLSVLDFIFCCGAKHFVSYVSQRP